jgi:hypothetical protein
MARACSVLQGLVQAAPVLQAAPIVAALSPTPSANKPLKEFSAAEVGRWVAGLEMNPAPWLENAVAGRDLVHLEDHELKVRTQVTPNVQRNNLLYSSCNMPYLMGI